MVLQNKTANKGRAANVRTATDPSLNPRVIRERCICLLATPDSRQKPRHHARVDGAVNYERRPKRTNIAIARITDAAHFDDERAPHAIKHSIQIKDKEIVDTKDGALSLAECARVERMIAQLITESTCKYKQWSTPAGYRVAGFGARFFITRDWFRLIIYKSVPVYLSADGRARAALMPSSVIVSIDLYCL